MMCTCVTCGLTMENLSVEGFQPVGGLAFYSYGHYGSAEFDPMDGSCVEIVLCDSCFTSADKLLHASYKGEIR